MNLEARKPGKKTLKSISSPGFLASRFYFNSLLEDRNQPLSEARTSDSSTSASDPLKIPLPLPISHRGIELAHLEIRRMNIVLNHFRPKAPPRSLAIRK
jgi:hypothetical protein